MERAAPPTGRDVLPAQFNTTSPHCVLLDSGLNLLYEQFVGERNSMRLQYQNFIAS